MHLQAADTIAAAAVREEELAAELRLERRRSGLMEAELKLWADNALPAAFFIRMYLPFLHLMFELAVRQHPFGPFRTISDHFGPLWTMRSHYLGLSAWVRLVPVFTARLRVRQTHCPCIAPVLRWKAQANELQVRFTKFPIQTRQIGSTAAQVKDPARKSDTSCSFAGRGVRAARAATGEPSTAGADGPARQPVCGRQRARAGCGQTHRIPQPLAVCRDIPPSFSD